MPTSTLFIVPLSFPLILLPTGRITIPIRATVGEVLLQLIQESEAQPIVAAVPIPAVDSASLHEWGCAARVVRIVRPPKGVARDGQQPYLLTLHGLSRIHLPDAEGAQDHFEDGIFERIVEYPQATIPPTPEAASTFKATAARLLDRLIQDSASDTKKEFYTKLAGMVDDVQIQRAPWLADLLISSLNAEYTDKLDFLSAFDVNDRLKRATEMFIKQTSISEVSKKIAQSIDESLSRQQKEFFLRQQRAAIDRELRSIQRSSPSQSRSSPSDPTSSTGSTSELDDDEQADAADMADIRAKIEAMAQDSEERKTAVREWRRLRRIPAGSVEHGVIRNYLEWLAAMPWPASVGTVEADRLLRALRDREFLLKARKQLDIDHYGLEKIKKRLIEYLAVVRLKELQAEKGARIAQEGHELHKTDDTPQLDANSGALVKLEKIDPTSIHPTPPRIRRKSTKGPILLFVGPPGTGKTSLGQSIARALDRPFQRISLGGVRDEAEIRGHRRTYVASSPGNIVQALRKAGRPDPVILLDEIDKIAHNNFHGDPAAALLEVLDPEQNHSFHDHYINVPVDLSQVLFICTSNTLETIAAPLLDRCEIVHLSGYTYNEKIHIARRFLIPKQLQANALTSDHLIIQDTALLHVATHYTREAGVRSLERAVGAIIRHKAVEWAEYCDSINADPDASIPATTALGKETATKIYNKSVEKHDLERILGIARWEEEEREERRGLVYGLVVTGMGEGDVMPVETSPVPEGSGKLKLTGSLGDVIKESADLALDWVKARAYDLYITKSRSQDPLKNPDSIDVHLHLPSGAVKKDGPSAGIAMVCAFVSLLTGACVSSDIAMTGEITLRGRVGPVGGIKEKVLGAHRARITKVIMPWGNRQDVEHDVPLEIRQQMKFVFVRTLEEVLEAAFGKRVIGQRRSDVLLESRL
ncbi:uncharacterized protein FIBRA_05342 [Fibroporia radiculosa]|uniref:Lon protease homolog n=1 Tax=Fibroporia radiculosa TaxID=599839 RepID=J4G955_9APHY|nr:uncharacterized protein FIBRA_05342 [Fibroporia radiculosa]CCM03218.1 predicted protein [Fibroporia radiculosa]